ncbi:MAG: saccharopine dehydrogenase family protein [Bacillota bacterium]
MKVAVLGGAGGMGSRAASDIAFQGDVTELTIGDINLGSARKLAGEINHKLGKEKVKAAYIDANLPDTVMQAIRGCDVVASAIGPYYLYGKKVAEAIIESGIYMVDICDDYDALQDIFSLQEKAEKNGAVVLTGMGWTPGLSNLLAAKGIEEMDEAVEVDIYWAGSPVGDSGLAVILHTLHIFTGSIPTFVDGGLVSIPAGSEREEVLFDELGRCTMFHVGHPEPVTLPKKYPFLKKVSLKGGLTDHLMNEISLLIGGLGLTAAPSGKHMIGTMLKPLLPAISPFLKNQETRSAVKVEVRGRVNGREALVVYEANAKMEDLTGLPLAIGTLLLGRGKITGRGVMAPEAGVPLGEFFDEIAARGIKIAKTVG